MSDALPPLRTDFARQARREQQWVLGVCALTSLLAHLALFWLWSQPGGRVGVASVSARLRSIAAAPQVASPELALPMAGVKPAASAAAQAGSAPRPAEEGGAAHHPAGRVAPPDLSDYTPVEQLTSRPRFLMDMREYVPASLDEHEVGRIVLQVLISEGGEVDGVVVESSELSPRGTRRFVQRLDALRLAPGMFDGQPVKSRWRLEFSFAALE